MALEEHHGDRGSWNEKSTGEVEGEEKGEVLGVR